MRHRDKTSIRGCPTDNATDKKLPHGAAPTPRKIARRISDLLTDCDEFLIIERTGTPYYVQFLPTGEGALYGEAVSNEFLEGQHRLDEEQQHCLGVLGWKMGTFNFNQRWPAPVDIELVTGIVVMTLEMVFGAEPDSDLTYQFGARQFPPYGTALLSPY